MSALVSHRISFAAIIALLLLSLFSCGNDSEETQLRNAADIMGKITSNEDWRRYNRDSTLEEIRAVNALQDTSPWEHPDIYAAMLKHETWVVRGVAIYAIRNHDRLISQDSSGKSSDNPFFETLVDIAKHDPVWDVRSEAASALGHSSDARVCSELDKLLHSKIEGSPIQIDTGRGNYLSAVVSSLRRQNCPGSEDLLKQKDMDIERIIDVLGNADPGQFYGNATNEQLAANDSLIKKDSIEYYDTFLSHINHPNPVVRNAMSYMLAKSRKPEALEPLLKLINTDPIIQVRDIAIMNLGRFGYKQACPELEGLLDETEFGENRKNAITFLTAEKIHARVRLTMRELKCHDTH